MCKWAWCLLETVCFVSFCLAGRQAGRQHQSYILGPAHPSSFSSSYKKKEQGGIHTAHFIHSFFFFFSLLLLLPPGRPDQRKQRAIITKVRFQALPAAPPPEPMMGHGLGSDRIGSVRSRTCILRERPTLLASRAIAGLRELPLGEAPQVAAARTDRRGGGGGGPALAAGSRTPARGILEGSLGASPEGPHCGTLKSVYIGQRRLFKQRRRGACWRDSTDARVRMATTGAWSSLRFGSTDRAAA